MNPYLEAYWSDVHTSLVTYIRDSLQEQLPTGLVARAEERVAVDEGGVPIGYRTDVAVKEAWREKAAVQKRQPAKAT